MSVNSSQLADLITVEFRSADASGNESDLQQYLEKELGVRLLVELVESANWPITTLFLSSAAVPIAKYAGKKLMDVLADLVRAWLQDKQHIQEVVLYGPDGKIVKVTKNKH
jgi:hypothetical protein